MAFSRPTLPELIAQTQADFDSLLPGSDSRLRRSIIGVIAFVIAALCHGLYGFIQGEFKNRFTDTSDDENVRREAALYGLTPKAAVAATGEVTASGTIGSVVPINTVLQRSDGAQFKTSAATTFASTSETIAVVAVLPGENGNTVTASKLSLVAPVSGVNSQMTVASPGLLGGLNEESTESLRSRVLDRRRNPPEVGNQDDYERWAKEYPEVTRAWCYPRIAGNGTVGVYFMMDDRSNPIPTNTDKTNFGAYIDTKAPDLCTRTIYAPTAAPIALSIALTPNTQAVKDAVSASLKDMLRRESEPGGTIKISKIREAISVAAGETNYVMSTPSADVTVTGGAIATLGVITWT